MTPTPFNEDDNNNDPEAEAAAERARAQVEMLTEMGRNFMDRASSEIGVYVTADAAIQYDPESGRWVMQTLLEFGDRAYAKVQEPKRNDDKFFEAMELDIIKDDLLRGLTDEEGEEGDDNVAG